MRIVDGLKIGFVHSEEYFESFATPSMGSTARTTGADVVFLLAPNKTEEDLTDDDIRDILSSITTRDET